MKAKLRTAAKEVSFGIWFRLYFSPKMEWLIGNYLIKPSYFSPNELSKLYAWKIRLGVSELLNVTQLLHLLMI